MLRVYVLVIVEVFVRPCVCLSVTLRYCVKTTQARITKSSLWTATRTIVLGFVFFSKLEKNLIESPK